MLTGFTQRAERYCIYFWEQRQLHLQLHSGHAAAVALAAVKQIKQCTAAYGYGELPNFFAELQSIHAFFKSWVEECNGAIG